MESKLVSVIMPVYNGEGYIKQAIESMLAQTYSNWELVVVDDGSTDNTAQTVSNINDCRIIYIYQENHGQAAALNHGLDVARGEYITTLDADDWMPINSLADRVFALSIHSEYDAVYGDGYYCTESGKPIRRFSDYRTENLVGDLFDILIVTSFFGTGAPVMIRRSFLETNQLRYDESIVWCQDVDFYIRLAEKARFGYVDTITVMYRLHNNNMTLQMPEGRRLDSLIHTKNKALKSSRFQLASDETKYSFFYVFLVRDLCNHVNLQDEIINNSYFKGLEKTIQSRVLRQMAISYLADDFYVTFARKWLKNSWRLSPLDLKTGIALILSYLNIKPVKFLIRMRNRQSFNDELSNPFVLAKNS